MDKGPNSAGSCWILASISQFTADELTSIVFSSLDHRNVCLCCQVCKAWRTLGMQEDIWKVLCIRLWSDKVHVPNEFLSMLKHRRSRAAFKGSLLDSKRVSITLSEFSSFRFYFRFKKAAGNYWTDKDPFWRGECPICVSFNKEGPVPGNAEVKWDFSDAIGQDHSFIRVSIKNHSIPTYLVSRHINWGFIIQVRV